MVENTKVGIEKEAGNLQSRLGSGGQEQWHIGSFFDVEVMSLNPD